FSLRFAKRRAQGADDGPPSTYLLYSSQVSNRGANSWGATTVYAAERCATMGSFAGKEISYDSETSSCFGGAGWIKAEHLSRRAEEIRGREFSRPFRHPSRRRVGGARSFRERRGQAVFLAPQCPEGHSSHPGLAHGEGQSRWKYRSSAPEVDVVL